jgi:hypothetical protein
MPVFGATDRRRYGHKGFFGIDAASRLWHVMGNNADRQCSMAGSDRERSA